MGLETEIERRDVTALEFVDKPLPKGKRTPLWVLSFRSEGLKEQRKRNKVYDEDLDFVDGIQWNSEEKRFLRKNKRLETVDNQLFVMNELLEGVERQRRLQPHLTERTIEETDAVGIVNHRLDYQWDRVNGQDLFCEVADWSRRVGIGWCKVFESSLMGTEKIRSEVLDPRRMIWDTKSQKKDKSDAEFIGEERWMLVSDVLRRWKHLRKDIEQLIDVSGQYSEGGEIGEDWRTIGDVRSGNIVIPPAQYWDDSDGRGTYNKDTRELCVSIMQYRRYVEQWFVVYEDGKEEPFQLPEGMEEEQALELLADYLLDNPQTHMEKGDVPEYREITFIGPVLVEDKLAPFGGKMFTYCPRTAYTDKNGREYGIIRQWKGKQKMINLMTSKLIEILSTKRIFVNKADMGGMTATQWEEQGAKPNGLFMMNNINNVRIEQDLNVSSAFFEMVQSEKESLKHNTGLVDEMRGQGGQDQAFVTLEARRQQGMIIVERILGAGETWMKRFTIILLQAMRFYGSKVSIFKAKENGEDIWVATGIEDPQKVSELQALAAKNGIVIKITGDISSIEAEVEITMAPNQGTEQEARRDRLIEWAGKISDPVLQTMFIARAIALDSFEGAKELSGQMMSYIGMQQQQQAEAAALQQQQQALAMQGQQMGLQGQEMGLQGQQMGLQQQQAMDAATQGMEEPDTVAQAGYGG